MDMREIAECMNCAQEFIETPIGEAWLHLDELQETLQLKESLKIFGYLYVENHNVMFMSIKSGDKIFVVKAHVIREIDEDDNIEFEVKFDSDVDYFSIDMLALDYMYNKFKISRRGISIIKASEIIKENS